MVIRRSLLLVLFLLLSISAVSAVNCMYYFYGEGCEKCSTSTVAITTLDNEQPEADIQQYEVYYSPENGERLRQLYAAAGVPREKQGLPVVFFAGSYLLGEEPILTFSKERLLDSSACPSVIPEKTVGVTGTHQSLNIFDEVKFSEITAGAFLDAFHPGMWALVLLLLLLLSGLDRVHAVRSGVPFVIAVFFVYFLFAYGFFTKFSLSSGNVLLYRGVAWLAIIFGVVVTKNFIWRWRLFQLPPPSKQKIETLWQALRSPAGMFFIGFAAALFSLAKLSGTFLSMRLSLQGETTWTAVPILFYYLFWVLLPLLAVLFLLYVTQDKLDQRAVRRGDEKVHAWREHHRQVMHVVTSMICFLLGIVLLFM